MSPSTDRQPPYDAARSRTKRPLPLWVDAFQRDTAMLEADEVGAYLNILMAMWSTPRCAIPGEARKMARAAGVSPRLWKSRIGPSLRDFFTFTEDGWATQGRLLREARYIEKHLNDQHAKSVKREAKKAADAECRGYAKPQVTPDAHQDAEINNRKPLKTNERHSTTDTTANTTAGPPTQQPNNPTVEVRDSIPAASLDDSRGTTEAEGQNLLVLVMEACRVREFPIPRYWMPPAALVHVSRWVTEKNLTVSEILQVCAANRERHPNDPPRGPKLLDQAMQDMADAKAAPQHAPRKGRTHERPRAAELREGPGTAAAASAEAGRAIADGSIETVLGDPFAPGSSWDSGGVFAEPDPEGSGPVLPDADDGRGSGGGDP